MLWYVRHGQSQANLYKIFAGQDHLKAPLTDVGCEQARLAAASLIGVGIARIITSPLHRAVQTAHIIADELNMPRDVIAEDERISEYGLGALRGQPQRKLTAELMRTIVGAEEPAHYQARIIDFVREHANDEPPTLMVSHAGTMNIIQATQQQLSPEDFYAMQGPPNAQAIALDLSWLPSVA